MSVDGWPDVDGTALSRSGTSGPGGKLSRRIDVPVSEDLDDAIGAIAAITGIPKAEAGRRIWERVIFGELNMVRRIAQHHGLCPSDELRDGRG